MPAACGFCTWRVGRASAPTGWGSDLRVWVFSWRRGMGTATLRKRRGEEGGAGERAKGEAVSRTGSTPCGRGVTKESGTASRVRLINGHEAPRYDRPRPDRCAQDGWGRVEWLAPVHRLIRPRRGAGVHKALEVKRK